MQYQHKYPGFGSIPEIMLRNYITFVFQTVYSLKNTVFQNERLTMKFIYYDLNT